MNYNNNFNNNNHQQQFQNPMMGIPYQMGIPMQYSMNPQIMNPQFFNPQMMNPQIMNQQMMMLLQIIL